MLLAIEQGNTNSLFAIHDGANWIADGVRLPNPTGRQMNTPCGSPN